MRNRFNLLAKGVDGKEYLITDFIATKLTETQANKMIEQFDVLKGYRFIPYEETDFSWWDRVTKKLTAKKLTEGNYFECDFHGNVTEY